MDNETIKQLRRAWNKTTKKVWSYAEEGTLGKYRLESDIGEYVFPEELSNANFIALAHNLMPEILYVLEDAQIELEEARAERDYYRKKAKAGERLVEAVEERLNCYNPKEGNLPPNRHWREIVKPMLLAEYDKSVNE